MAATLSYMDPDSNLKGPLPPTRLFSRKETWLNLLPLEPLYLGVTKIPMTTTLSCTGAQAVALKGPCPSTRLFIRKDA